MPIKFVIEVDEQEDTFEYLNKLMNVTLDTLKTKGYHINGAAVVRVDEEGSDVPEVE